MYHVKLLDSKVQLKAELHIEDRAHTVPRPCAERFVSLTICSVLFPFEIHWQVMFVAHIQDSHPTVTIQSVQSTFFYAALQ